MLQARQIALIDGKPVYRDCEGNLCTETSDYRFLRALTEKEEDKLSKTEAVYSSHSAPSENRHMAFRD